MSTIGTQIAKVSAKNTSHLVIFFSWTGCRSAKKSLPLSSTTMNAGKSTTWTRHTASMPSSGYSSTSTFLMLCSANNAAGPPIEPR